MDAFWDYRASTCGGTAPTLASRPRTHGATILATSLTTDVTLLLLATTPTGLRYYLGWNPNPVLAGTMLYRVSQPDGGPQRYAEMVVDGGSSTCIGWPRGPSFYSAVTFGGAGPGSSGAPAMYGNGVVVGQLQGGCGPRVDDPCDAQTRNVDGAFAQSYPLLQPFIDPADTTQCNACVPSPTTACVLGNRFQVTVSWATYLGAKATGTGKIIKYAENKPDIHPVYGPLNENVFFSFFDGAPNSVEAMVRVFKGAAINDKYWVTMSSLTNVEYTVTVTDTTNCRKWEHTNPWTQTTSYSDLNAFPFP